MRSEHRVFAPFVQPREQTLLCHLSGFDAYMVPTACVAKLKAPKPYAFALKSVDKATMFESADDVSQQRDPAFSLEHILPLAQWYTDPSCMLASVHPLLLREERE